MSTALLEAPADHGRVVGRGSIEVFDADKLRFAVQSGKLQEHEFIDGAPSIGNLRKAVALRQLNKRALATPRHMKAALSRDGGQRPSLWVPAHALKRLGLAPDEVIDAGENLFLTAGITRLWANFNAVPTSTAVFDATHCRVGVGDGSTAALAADTTLTGSTNKWFQILDGAPSGTTNSTSRTATTPTGQGNFVWACWGVDNGTASAGTAAGATIEVAPLFSHAVVALGTKTSAAAWAFTVTHSIT